MLAYGSCAKREALFADASAAHAGDSAGAQAIAIDGRALPRGRYDATLCALTNDALHPNLPVAITVWSDARSWYLPVVRR